MNENADATFFLSLWLHILWNTTATYKPILWNTTATYKPLDARWAVHDSHFKLGNSRHFKAFNCSPGGRLRANIAGDEKRCAVCLGGGAWWRKCRRSMPHPLSWMDAVGIFVPAVVLLDAETGEKLEACPFCTCAAMLVCCDRVFFHESVLSHSKLSSRGSRVRAGVSGLSGR